MRDFTRKSLRILTNMILTVLGLLIGVVLTIGSTTATAQPKPNAQ